MRFVLGSLFLASLGFGGCSGSFESDVGTDAGTPDADSVSDDAADDATPDAAPDATVRCTSDDACRDSSFCSGVERCRPDDPAADEQGCVVLPVCLPTQTCDEVTETCRTVCDLEPDADGDGHAATECGGDDCDDSNDARFPGALEVCDAEGVDEDCDATTFGTQDVDEDGHDDARCCNGSVCGLDCDDTSATVGPAGVESCNGHDDDCDGVVDEDSDAECGGDARCEAGACVPNSRLSVTSVLSCMRTGGYVDCWSSVGSSRGDGRPDTPRASVGRLVGIDDAVSVDLAGYEAPHGCVVRATGRVACWGGRGGSSVPVEMPSIDDAVEVGARDAGACARRRSGGVVCWGTNQFGQLGTGDFDVRSTPTPVVGIVDAIELDVANPLDGHACARTRDRRVWCWGNNEHGELSNGTLESSPSPTLVRDAEGRPVENVDSVVVGARFTCWLRAGIVECAGRPVGDLDGEARTHPVAIEGLPTNVRTLVGGDLSACVTTEEGASFCWGNTRAGQTATGLRSLVRRVAPPGRALVLDGADEVALGTILGCMRRGDALMCWGENRLRDPLGNGGSALASVVEGFEDGARGHSGRCGSDVTGAYWCWGRTGEVGGHGGTSVPYRLPAFDGSVASSTDLQTCAIDAEGRIRCQSMMDPMLEFEVPGVVDAVEVHATASCARIEDGSVVCWTAPVLDIPVAVTELPLERTTDLAVFQRGSGYGFVVCATTESRELVCWSGRSRATRVGGADLSETPVTIAVGSPVRKVAMCDSDDLRPSTCVIRDGGGVACTGDPMGTFLGGTRETFTDVVGVANAVEIEMNAEDGAVACALRMDGRVLCWGQSSKGALGRPIPSSVPAVEVEGLTDATSLAQSEGTFCANSTSRGLVCWGSDDHGGLGRGIARPVTLLP